MCAVSKSKQFVCAYDKPFCIDKLCKYTAVIVQTDCLYSAARNTVPRLLFADEHMLTAPSLQEETVHQHGRMMMMMDVGALPKLNFNWPFINLFAQEADSQRRDSW